MLNFSSLSIRRGRRLLFADATFSLFRGEKEEDAFLRKLWNNNDTVMPETMLLSEEIRRGGVRKHEAKEFNILAPMAFAGLDKLPSTMKSRAITRASRKPQKRCASANFPAPSEHSLTSRRISRKR